MVWSRQTTDSADDCAHVHGSMSDPRVSIGWSHCYVDNPTKNLQAVGSVFIKEYQDTRRTHKLNAYEANTVALRPKRISN